MPHTRHHKIACHNALPTTRRGFSLVEVLLAILILGIGLIMVASVFPVGANWTRQATEESVAQTIAQDAFGVIQSHYSTAPLNSYMRPDFLNAANQNSVLKSANPFQLQAIPGFNAVPMNLTYGIPTYGIPINERTYQFGSSTPFPSTNALACTYYWTALIRLNPAYRVPLSNQIILSSSYKYDLYILVFRKGAAEHTFTDVAPVGYAEVAGLRDLDGSGAVNGSEFRIPSVFAGNYYPGDIDPGRSPTIYNAVPALGSYGIGLNSGTVFKQVVDANNTLIDFTVIGTNRGATARPAIIQPALGVYEPVVFSPPADSTNASPLIYVYQTTLSL